jgi:hypothetical protein
LASATTRGLAIRVVHQLQVAASNVKTPIEIRGIFVVVNFPFDLKKNIFFQNNFVEMRFNPNWLKSH